MTRTANDAVASYVTDMLALEHHIQKAIGGQIADLENESPFINSLRTIHATTEAHIAKFDALVDRRGLGIQGVSEKLKNAASTVLGMGAAAIDFVRSEKFPKNLRDDYTALSLASIGYVMLHTTALSLGDDEVASLAHEFLADHAKCVMMLHDIAPAAVVLFLQEDGLPAEPGVLPKVAENLAQVWTAGAVSA